jgi:hypothetical protein
MKYDFWIETTASCWFNAASEGKKHGFYRDWDVSFAINMGKRVIMGKRPTPLQEPIAKNLWLIYQQFLHDQIAKNKKCMKECYKDKSKD